MVLFSKSKEFCFFLTDLTFQTLFVSFFLFALLHKMQTSNFGTIQCPYLLNSAGCG